jgi:hypothetical protein
MGSSLWFVTDGITVLGCFETEIAAEEFMEQFCDDADYNFYDYYYIQLNDLEDYPDEYALAEDEGLV